MSKISIIYLLENIQKNSLLFDFIQRILYNLYKGKIEHWKGKLKDGKKN